MDGRGRPSERQTVVSFRIDNPDGTKTQCREETKLDYKTIAKWWDSEIIQVSDMKELIRDLKDCIDFLEQHADDLVLSAYLDNDSHMLYGVKRRNWSWIAWNLTDDCLPIFSLKEAVEWTIEFEKKLKEKGCILSQVSDWPVNEEYARLEFDYWNPETNKVVEFNIVIPGDISQCRRTDFIHKLCDMDAILSKF